MRDYTALMVLLFFFGLTLYGSYVNNQYHKLKEALHNSNITCVPVKVTDAYYCDSKVSVIEKDKSVVIEIKQ